jgi:cytochrome o ubiquinol oxidase operon protein cyoD
MSRFDSTTKSIITYSVGFLSSIILTLAAYAIVVQDTIKNALSPAAVAILLAIFASIQLAVQLIFFLHLSEESKPRWKLMSFLFAFIILGIIVIGSLCIMFDLNSRMMMSTEQMTQYMNRQTGL